MELAVTFEVKDKSEVQRLAQQLAAWAVARGVKVVKTKIDTEKSVQIKDIVDLKNTGIDKAKRDEAMQKRKALAMTRLPNMSKVQLQKMARRKGIAISQSDDKNTLLTKLIRTIDK